MRFAVYTDYAYHRLDDAVYAERAFALFLARLGSHFERLTLLGRLRSVSGDEARYPLGAGLEFIALPYYGSLTEPRAVLAGAAGALLAFWRVLGRVDAVCMFGPHPLAFPVALMTWARRKKLILGVRQDTPEYVRYRHPDSRLLQGLARVMDLGFRVLGRFSSVIVVGPAVAERYRRAHRLLQISVSLVDEEDIIEPGDRGVDYTGPLTALSVGRLDAEKNPLLLADVLAKLVERDPRWRLMICGEGNLEAELRGRLAELGVEANAELHGYVPMNDGLMSLYRHSHVLLHVSWTEGVPQVIYEAFAAALPVVATNVGGVGHLGAGALLIPPGDAEAAAEAVNRMGHDAALRDEKAAAGQNLLRGATMQAECIRVAEFIKGA